MKSPDMEYVPCNLCGADDTELLFTSPDRMFHKNVMFNIVRCKRCGLVYTNPRPTPEHIGDFYPTEEYLPFSNFRNPILRRIKKTMVKRNVREIKKLIGNKARILEVGCGTGEYLADLRDLGGWDVAGVELSPYAANIARERFALDITTGTLFDAAFPAESFNLVLMRYVLEHVHNPVDNLNRISNILGNNGKFIFWIPNVDSIGSRVFGKYWGGFDIPRHLYHYSPQTSGKLLNSAGMKISRISYSPIPNDLVWSFRYVSEAKRLPEFITRTISVDNAPWMAVFAPLSATSALIRKCGQIKVIAEKAAGIKRR